MKMRSVMVDKVARAVATPVSRRRALGCVGAGLLAALLGVEHAAAACKPSGKTCDKHNDCCSKRCKQGRCRCKYLTQSCQVTANCCSGTCEGGTCCLSGGATCAIGSNCCSGVCYTLSNGKKTCLDPAG